MRHRKYKTLASFTTRDEAVAAKNQLRAAGHEGALIINSPSGYTNTPNRFWQLISQTEVKPERVPQRPALRTATAVNTAIDYEQTPAESELVRRYWDYMAEQGYMYDTEVPAGPNRIDLFYAKRSFMGEAKRDVSPASMRGILAQLLDYSQDKKAAWRFGLTPERPPLRYEQLLMKHGIFCVWETPDGFADNAAGWFTH